LTDDEVDISGSAAAIVNTGVVARPYYELKNKGWRWSLQSETVWRISTYSCAVGTKYCEGVRGYDTEPILIVNARPGLVEKRVRPEEPSILPPAADKNLLYTQEGM